MTAVERRSRTKDIDVTITSTEGCTVTITGTVHFTIVPPEITGFRGSVTIGGGKGCPTGSMTFTAPEAERARPDQLVVAVTQPDVGGPARLRWSGGRDAVAELLNEPALACTLRRVVDVARSPDLVSVAV